MPDGFPEDFKFVPHDEGFKGLGCFAATNTAWLECSAEEFFAKRHTLLHTKLRDMCDLATMGSDMPEVLHCAHLCASYSASTKLSAFIRQMPVKAGFTAIRGHRERLLQTINAILGGDALFLRSEGAVTGDDLLAQKSNASTDGGRLRDRVELARFVAVLPASLHGLGYQDPHITHSCAALAAWIATFRHVNTPGAVSPMVVADFDHDLEGSTLQTFKELHDAWTQLVTICKSEEDILRVLKIDSFGQLASTPVTNPQTKLTELAHAAVSARLVATAAAISEGDRRRLISAAGIGAGAALQALPFSPASTLNNWELRTTTLIRLGLPVPNLRDDFTHCATNCVAHATEADIDDPNIRTFPDPTGRSKQLVRRTIPDEYGHHTMGCNYSNTNWVRHQRLRDALLTCLRRARIHAVAVDREVTRDTRAYLGFQQADIVLPDYMGLGRCVYIDVTVTHPLLLSNLTRGYERAGDAVRVARAVHKRAQYAVLEDYGNRFVVFGAESYGAFDPDAIAWFEQHVVHAYVTAHNQDPHSRLGKALASRFRSNSLQTMAVAIQQGNAQGIRRSTVLRHPNDYSSYLAKVVHPSPRPRKRRRPPVDASQPALSPSPTKSRRTARIAKPLSQYSDGAMRSELRRRGRDTTGGTDTLRSRLAVAREQAKSFDTPAAWGPGFPAPHSPTPEATAASMIHAASDFLDHLSLPSALKPPAGSGATIAANVTFVLDAPGPINCTVQHPLTAVRSLAAQTYHFSATDTADDVCARFSCGPACLGGPTEPSAPPTLCHATAGATHANRHRRCTYVFLADSKRWLLGSTAGLPLRTAGLLDGGRIDIYYKLVAPAATAPLSMTAEPPELFPAPPPPAAPKGART